MKTILRAIGGAWYRSIGASGAVSAILFTSIFLNPWDKILLFAAIPVPGIVFGVIYPPVHKQESGLSFS